MSTNYWLTAKPVDHPAGAGWNPLVPSPAIHLGKRVATSEGITFLVHGYERPSTGADGTTEIFPAIISFEGLLEALDHKVLSPEASWLHVVTESNESLTIPQFVLYLNAIFDVAGAPTKAQQITCDQSDSLGWSVSYGDWE